MGWEASGGKLSYALSLYPDIGKALVHMGVSQKVITTLPRKGVMTAAGIAKPIFSEEGNQVNATGYNVHPPKDPTTEISVLDINNLTGLITIKVIMLVATFIFSAFLLFSPTSGSDYFSGYLYAGKMDNGCQYYFNSDADDHDQHQLFLPHHPEICQTRKYVYLTAWLSYSKYFIYCLFVAHECLRNNL